MYGRWRELVADLVLGAGLVGAGAFLVTSWQILRDGRRHPAVAADVAIVFGAAIWTSGPSPELIARLDRAADLYARGSTPLIVCCGGRTDGVSEGAVMRTLLLNRGIPAGAILVDDRGATSRDALEAVASLGRGRWHMHLLVSSSYHMHRLLREAHRRGLVARPAPVTLLPLRLSVRTVADRRLLLYQVTIHIREVLAVWWYALPLRFSTIETGKAARIDRASAELTARLATGGEQSDAPSGPVLRAPIDGQVTSGFGWRSPRHHDGVDFDVPYGALVRTAAAGTVAYAGRLPMYGRVVAVDHGGCLATVYGHLSSLEVEAGQALRAGSPIGRVGSSGNAFGPHLHFEARHDGVPVDPGSLMEVELVMGGAPVRGRVQWALRRLSSLSGLDRLIYAAGSGRTRTRG